MKSAGETADDRSSPFALLWRGLSRGEWVAASAIALVALCAWIWIGTLPPMPVGSMPTAAGASSMAMGAVPWTASRAAATFAMWAIMMGAMMLPAAAPIVLLHRRMALTNQTQGAAAPPTFLLVLGYTLVWTTFAGVATISQWALSQAALLTNADALADRRVAGGVLIAAGLYQWTPLKQACLRLCRSPLAFLMRDYRAGASGALRMGITHGAYCLACCWAAMALLFVGGVMNLLWIAALAMFVLVEKAAPFGRSIGKVLGAAAALAGLYLTIGIGVR